MAYVHEIVAGNLQWILFTTSLLVGALQDGIMLILRRGLGRRGLGPFRLFRVIRILFVLLFTTLLGPIVLVVLIVAGAYWFFNSRR